MYEIVVPGYIPRSPNRSARKHWGRSMEERLFWEHVVGHAAWREGIPRAWKGKRWVEYEIHKPGAVKLRDEDNLVASVKHIQDALVNLGLLEDDDITNLDFRGVTEYNGKRSYCTIIRIGDVRERATARGYPA